MRYEISRGRRAPAILFAVFVLSAQVRAEGERTVGDLSRIQSETIILKAQVARAAAQAELDSKRRGAGTPGDAIDVPVVGNVYGHGGKWIAEFLYSNGAKVDGAEGATIVGGFKVVSVQLDEVVLSRGGKAFRAAFSGRTLMQPSAGVPGSAMVPPTPIIR